LLNIIINAIEVMEPGKGILKINAVGEKGKCIITIEDNGTGISEEILTGFLSHSTVPSQTEWDWV